MPILKSSKKALRVALRRRSENLKRTAALKVAIKDFRKAKTGQDVGSLIRKVQSTLDRAAATKTIHRNKAARLKSQLTKAAIIPKVSKS